MMPSTTGLMPPGSALSVTSIFIIESVRPDAAGERPPGGVSSPPSTASATVTPLILAVKQESERWRDPGTLVLSTRDEMQIFRPAQRTNPDHSGAKSRVY